MKQIYRVARSCLLIGSLAMASGCATTVGTSGGGAGHYDSRVRGGVTYHGHGHGVRPSVSVSVGVRTGDLIGTLLFSALVVHAIASSDNHHRPHHHRPQYHRPDHHRPHRPQRPQRPVVRPWRASDSK